MRFVARCAVAAAGCAAALLAGASAAGADAVTEGDCFGEGTWQEGGFTESSGEHDTGDTIEIPRADSVEWAGGIGDFEPGQTGPEREIEGEVELVLPSKVAVVVDDWGPNDSVVYANAGVHDYDVPSMLIGIRMRLQGEHREDGEVVCAGSVYVQVEGSALDNPLAYVGLAGMVLSGGVLVLAGKAA